ncbi:acetyl-CoA hydrolase [Seongchinamella sediminis]|uniref:Acetyl-CoA hydrolase n=1 Tax=Seongchinamella sediminis TaxID=2283635 RepID=A0A3L7DWR4_9GAMM|nr:acetyl-CoA hydrolase/transferase C-terminal domain-containing protein [Seongchinamella sediminis]RLQ20401.1 acetyl-CoA hydrolase [Seongchinamella sediminis]
MTEVLASVETCVDRIIEAVGPDISVGAPLGLGKPVQLLNALYHRVAGDSSLSLHIYTALCLEVPKPGSHIEEGLAGPIMKRMFGDYEELAFLGPFRRGEMPANVQLTELYFKAGSMKNHPVAQQNYISSNYTHIARDMLDSGVNVMLQLVASEGEGEQRRLSFSCNPDISPEILQRQKSLSRRVYFAAQVHSRLPFMEHDAETDPGNFDWIVDNREYDKTLFAVPNAAVPLRDYATALHASTLIEDGGTLQIGIGSLGDAVAHSCILRHRDNAAYRRLVAGISNETLHAEMEQGEFVQGLYVSTEMFVNGMMHLIEQGVVKRRVYDELALQSGLNEGRISESVDARLWEYGRESGLIPRQLDSASRQRLVYWGVLPDELALDDAGLSLAGQELANDLDDSATRGALLQAQAGKTLRHGRVLHGGFFLGPRDFYRKLQDLDEEGHERICMTGVQRTNQLLLDYPLYCAQRRSARFINTGMIAALNGAVASDALEDGTVISGVGGQYNFVAMAHDLPGARSVLCIRATRGEGKQLKSNIVPHYGYTTIPKHLRDVIVTEYGVADLRGQSDAEVIRRMINIADSRFQPQLLEYAKRHGKLPQDYSIPFSARQNTPEKIAHALKPAVAEGLLPDYPFGTELTDSELALAASLRRIKALSEEPTHFISSAFKALLHHGDEEAARPFLERLHLEHPETTRDFLIKQLLMLDLEERGMLKVS